MYLCSPRRAISFDTNANEPFLAMTNQLDFLHYARKCEIERVSWEMIDYRDPQEIKLCLAKISIRRRCGRGQLSCTWRCTYPEKKIAHFIVCSY